MKFQLRIKGKPTEHFTDQNEFSGRLRALRKNHQHVVPLVGVPDSTKPNGTNWLTYSKYKKLKKEGVYGKEIC